MLEKIRKSIYLYVRKIEIKISAKQLKITTFIL